MILSLVHSRVLLHLLTLRGNYNTYLSTPKDQKPKDQEEKKPGYLAKNLEIYRRRQKKLKPAAVHQNKVFTDLIGHFRVQNKNLVLSNELIKVKLPL